MYQETAISFRSAAIGDCACANGVHRNVLLEFLRCNLIIESDVIAGESPQYTPGAEGEISDYA